MIAEISTCRMSFLGRRGAGPSFPTGRTQSSDTLRYSFEAANLVVRFGSYWGKAQEPSCEGAEDQAEAQRLPKMAPRNTGGHQRIRQQQDSCPASRKECRGQSRLPPGSVEHPNEWVQTPHVEESAERGKGVNPAGAYPVVPQCRPEGCQFRAPVETLPLGGSPSDVIAEEHVQEDEGCYEDGESQEDRSQLRRDSRRLRSTN